MLLVVSRSFAVVCCLLCVGRRLLFAVCFGCVPFLVYCVLCVARCYVLSLFAVRCLLMFAASGSLFVVVAVAVCG